MQVEETLDRRRYTPGRGLKIIRVKTEYIQKKKERREVCESGKGHRVARHRKGAKQVQGTMDSFYVGEGLHQCSALIPCLVAVVMDRLTDEVRQESPWTMFFADDIVTIVVNVVGAVCRESRAQVEETLDR